MINIPTRDQIAVAVCEMVNRRDSLTNENIGAYVARAVVAVAEMMFPQGRGSGKRNEKENENVNENVNENENEKENLENVEKKLV